MCSAYSLPKYDAYVGLLWDATTPVLKVHLDSDKEVKPLQPYRRFFARICMKYRKKKKTFALCT